MSFCPFHIFLCRYKFIVEFDLPFGVSAALTLNRVEPQLVYVIHNVLLNFQEKWIEKIMDAKDKFNCKHCMIFHKYSGKEKSPKIPSMETQLSDESEVSPRTQRRERMVKTHHKKSLSMDTVYI